MAYYSSSMRSAAPRQGRQRGATLRFPSVVCDECSRGGIVGTRWNCDMCRNFNLCDDCYHSSEHSQDHAFWRIDGPETTGFKVPPRRRPSESRRPRTSDREERVLQESLRVNQEGMFSVEPTGFHHPPDFDEEELAHGERWVFQDGLEALGSLWNDIGENVSCMLRGLEGEFDRHFRRPILDSCGLNDAFGSLGDPDIAAPTGVWSGLPSRQGYDEVQSYRGLLDEQGVPYEEEWQDRNAISHRGAEDDIVRTGWECECDGSGVLCTSCYVASRRSMEEDLWYHGSPSDARQSPPPRPPSTRPQVRDVYREVQAEREDGRRYQREAQVGSSAQAERGAQGDIESRLRELEAIHNCAICFEHRRNVVFTCGHGACASCAGNLRTCHICRQTITQRITVY